MTWGPTHMASFDSNIFIRVDMEEIAKIFGTCYAYQFDLAYDDVSVADWFYPYVYTMHKRDIMTGLDSQTFAPSAPLARAQFMVILHRMEGEPEATMFPKNHWMDVDDDWYINAIYWGFQNKIMTGYSNSDYWGTVDSITREQLATVMYRYADYKEYDTTKRAELDQFEDAASVSDFAKDAVQWAVAEGIITGKAEGTKLDPQGDTARAECAAMIQRFVEKYQL